MKINKKSIEGYILLLFAQIMVGICIVGSKILVQNIPVITILTIRFIIGFVILLTLHLLLNKQKITPLKMLSGVDWTFIIAQALCAGALFNILLIIGLKYTTASIAGIITSALPAIVTIFSILFLKERLTLYTTFCIVFAVLGLVIINANNMPIHNSNYLFGGMIILISLIPEAAYYVLAKYHQNKLPIFLVSALMNGINIPIFLCILIFQDQNMFPRMPMEQLLLLFIVGAGSALFYVFWFLGCRNVHGSSAGLTTAFMPIATLVIAFIFLNETISLVQLLGMMLVILSIILNASKQTPIITKNNIHPT